MIIDPQIFVDCAFAMKNGGRADRHESTSALTRMCRFRSHFGTTPILWALLLLKLYLPENVNAAMTGPDEKTFRKWSWLVVGLISDIEEELVSAA
jgi:hypothetical protein